MNDSYSLIKISSVDFLQINVTMFIATSAKIVCLYYVETIVALPSLIKFYVLVQLSMIW